jgi:hypothetical protein
MGTPLFTTAPLAVITQTVEWALLISNILIPAPLGLILENPSCALEL